jgi:hypothetical protein
MGPAAICGEVANWTAAHHYSHVGGEEKLAAAGQIVRLVFAPAEKKSDDATARGGSGGGSKEPEGEGAKNEAA